ncbi:uncharacterized protein LOC120173987, partial [Hibiscus syriacus]|uniref:uncharacterized protein LOC120173987 n=1 Tax=Hibiscus syriacus TaxID=106335 RepID=UPI0019241554
MFALHCPIPFLSLSPFFFRENSPPLFKQSSSLFFIILKDSSFIFNSLSCFWSLWGHVFFSSIEICFKAMGFYEETCTNSRSTKNGLIALHAAHHSACNEVKFKSLLTKMIWDFGLGCFIPGYQSKGSEKQQKNKGEIKGSNLEHNKAWLLAESSGGDELTSTDPQSVHSSFWFSFCSQVELDAMTANSLSSATVLMANLDNGVSDDRAKESKWRRIESLERSISPVTKSLVRFDYGEIASASRNFSKGMNFMDLVSFFLVFNCFLSVWDFDWIVLE